MLITFLLLGGFEKLKVLQKAYLEYIKNIADGQIRTGRVSLNKVFFLGLTIGCTFSTQVLVCLLL